MIEDVDYLKANSELESTVFFVDSSLRNRLHYADPSEYVIQFDQPYYRFRRVGLRHPDDGVHH